MFRSLVTVLLLVALAALLVAAVRRRNVAAAVNVSASLSVAALVVAVPDGLVGPGVGVWVAVAGVLHSIGMLGVYESRWWWDHLTHTVSAGLVAAFVYALALAAAESGAGLGPGAGAGAGVAAATLALTFAVGICWEVLELLAREVGRRYDVEPLLVNYGRLDTAFDVVFDVVGALVVLALDVRLLVPVGERVAAVVAAAFLVATVAVVATTALLALATVALRR
jgi:hypothetical protein